MVKGNKSSKQKKPAHTENHPAAPSTSKGSAEKCDWSSRTKSSNKPC